MPSAAFRFLVAKPVGWREATVLVVVAWLVPFLVHLIPWAGPRPLGVYLLPIFWTTFIALYFYGALPGLAIGLVTPLLNFALTGLPMARTLGLTTLELATFVAVGSIAVMRWPRFWFAAPLAWIAAKAATMGIQAIVPLFHYSDQPWRHLLRSCENGLTGLAVLAVIHWLLVAFHPKADADEAW